MAFQAPYEIAQSSLESLRISSVDSRESRGAIFPFFDEAGLIRFLVIDTLTAPAEGRPSADGGGVWIVEDFPLEIRRGKAIYPRPIMKYRPLAGIGPEALADLHHLDRHRTLPSRPALAGFAGPLDRTNLALRVRGRERVLDLFFTLDLRRLTGSVGRPGLFLKRRLELAALRRFLRDTESSNA